MTERPVKPEGRPSLDLVIDRELPISVSAQLLGQIEYGIATGEIAPGTRLPSVREAARMLAVAPVTISHVYKELQEAGLLASQQGRGTFVPDRLPPSIDAGVLAGLHQAVEELFAAAEALGVSRVAAAEAAMLRARQVTAPEPGLRLLYVGIYDEATNGYAVNVRRHLPKSATIRAVTFDRLTAEGLPEPPADVYITIANRVKSLREFVGPGPTVMALPLIPSADTRMQLAALAPDTRLGVTAGVPEFLPTVLRNVARYAPHVKARRVISPDGLADAEVANWCTALVYATGTEHALRNLAGGVSAFEFRHEPDPSAITAFLLPLLDSVRRSVATKEKNDEG